MRENFYQSVASHVAMLSDQELFSDDAMRYFKNAPLWGTTFGYGHDAMELDDKIQKHLLTKGGKIATKKLPSELEKLMQEEKF